MKPMFKSMLVALVVSVALGAVASASASAHEWLKDEAPMTKTEEISMTGSRIEMPVVGHIIECEAMKGTGTLSPGAGGNGEVTIHFSGCTGNGKTTCKAYSIGEPAGTITLANIRVSLEKDENHGGVQVLAERFAENLTRKEMATIAFKTEAEGACAGLVQSKLQGYIFGEASGEEVFFPTPELKHNTLALEGFAIDWITTFHQQWTSGGTLTEN